MLTPLALLSVHSAWVSICRCNVAPFMSDVSNRIIPASYLDIINHLKKLINSSGRKSYTFVMGKLNVAKMANFMEVDCYVLVACPENSLIDSKVCRAEKGG